MCAEQQRPRNVRFVPFIWRGAHTPHVAGGELSHAAPDVQRGAIAVLDSDGNVTWADDAWAVDNGGSGLARVPIGSNLLDAYRRQDDPVARAVANAIAAVLEGRATYFEIEHGASSERARSILTSVAALRGDRAGAAVIQRVVSGLSAITLRPLDAKTHRGQPIDRAIAGLTPREREVLDFMAAGLDNREIAGRLGIQYSTVRGHVRAVIEKLGARSRLEAVARAYQSGWVTRE
jgi:DNA-binding CsgD family transcriptional regulator